MPPSTNKNSERRMLRKEMQDLFDNAMKTCFPHLLPDEPFWVSPFRLLSEELQKKFRKKYGDHICINVFTICEVLRQLDPKLFRNTTSREIAKCLLEALKEENEKFKMLQRFSLHGAGYITFEFSMQWMTERIRTMLKAGIDTWAPVNVKSALVTRPSKAIDSDWQSHYIYRMLMRVLDYAGVYRHHPIPFRSKVGDNWIIKGGEMISVRNRTSLFGVKDTALKSSRSMDHVFDYVYQDLAVLWNAICGQEAQLIVFLTPAPLQAYVQKLFAAAKNEVWVAKYPLLVSCGYRASISSDVRFAWYQFEGNYPSLVKLGEAAGYSAAAFFASAVTYTYLKNHRLAICKFNFDEMFDEEGDTLVYLLNTPAIFPLPMGNLCSGGMVNYAREFSRKPQPQELYRKEAREEFSRTERELVVHLVQFTEVVNRVFLMLHPHLICEYTWTLCKKFRSYYKVLQHMGFRVYMSKLFLCEATQVVMKKCFHLLGISPQSPHSQFFAFIHGKKMYEADGEDMQIVPLPLCYARPIKSNPRFEMFSMNVHVKHSSFKMGDVFGIVALIDTDGVLADKRLPLEKNGNGHVSYYYRDWYEASRIKNNGIIHFRNPTPGYSPPFTTILEVYLRLYATTIDNDQCFLLCMSTFPIDMSKFWAGTLDYERSSLVFEGENATIGLEYIALRDAIDTSMELRFNSQNPLLKASFKGHIFAYYEGVLDGLDSLTQHGYKIILLHDNSKSGLTVDNGLLPLQRSVLAVPANGKLIIEALFFDVETGEVILKKKERLVPKPEGSDECHMPWRSCFFTLTVKWNQGPKSSYV